MITFFINAVSIGIGLAMDAFSVSLANGLYHPNMKNTLRIFIAGTFAFFQFLMPLIGWFCVHTIVSIFVELQKFIPWIAFIVLILIGGKMVIEGFKNKATDEEVSLNFKIILIQGIVTSIDALSVGFTISNVDILEALIESLIIGITTFIICLFGLYLGNKVGNKFNNKAIILGGIILIIIGSEILIKSFL